MRVHEAIGIAGLALVAAAWAASLKNPPPLRLSILYSAGSALLTLYSLLSSDAVFILLNSLALAFSLASAALRIRREKALSNRERGRA